MMNVYAIFLRYSLSFLSNFLICYGLVLFFNFVWINGSNRRKRKSFVSPVLTLEMNVYAPLSRLRHGQCVGGRRLVRAMALAERGKRVVCDWLRSENCGKKEGG